MQAHPSWLLFFFLTTPRCPELPGLSSFTNSTLLSYTGTQTAPGKSYLTWKIKQKGRKLFCWKFLDTYICCWLYHHHRALRECQFNVGRGGEKSVGSPWSPRVSLPGSGYRVTVSEDREREWGGSLAVAAAGLRSEERGNHPSQWCQRRLREDQSRPPTSPV